MESCYVLLGCGSFLKFPLDKMLSPERGQAFSAPATSKNILWDFAISGV